jgi:hypothetical protein
MLDHQEVQVVAVDLVLELLALAVLAALELQGKVITVVQRKTIIVVTLILLLVVVVVLALLEATEAADLLVMVALALTGNH